VQAVDKQEQLLDILAGYSASGLPTPDDVDEDKDDDDELTPRHNASLFSLEHSWTDVVRDHESLDKRQRDYQEAVWELLSTELDHISKLRVVVDVRHPVFLAPVQRTVFLLLSLFKVKLNVIYLVIYLVQPHQQTMQPARPRAQRTIP